MKLIPEEPSLPEALDKRDLLDLLRYFKLPPDTPSREYLLKIYLSYRMLMPVAPRGLEAMQLELGADESPLDLLPIDERFPEGAGLPPRMVNWLLGRLLTSLGFNTDLVPAEPSESGEFSEDYFVLVVEDDLGAVMVDAGTPLPILPINYDSREPTTLFSGFEFRLAVSGMHSFTGVFQDEPLYTTESAAIIPGEFPEWKEKMAGLLGAEADTLPLISWLKQRRYTRVFREQIEWWENGRVQESPLGDRTERLDTVRLGIPLEPDRSWLNRVLS